MRLAVAAHHERPVQALFQLHGLVHVGVVPECPRIRQHEPVIECLPRLDRLLHQLRAVHPGWDAQSVPVDARRLGKRIRQLNHQRVADIRLDDGAGHLLVEPISRRSLARRDLPSSLGGLKPHGHRLPGAHYVRTHRSPACWCAAGAEHHAALIAAALQPHVGGKDAIGSSAGQRHCQIDAPPHIRRGRSHRRNRAHQDALNPPSTRRVDRHVQQIHAARPGKSMSRRWHLSFRVTDVLPATSVSSWAVPRPTIVVRWVYECRLPSHRRRSPCHRS